MPVLADFRTDLDNLLGTAVDSSTWTTAIKDEAIRHALKQVDDHIIYETSFTVSSTGYSQDVSSVTDLNEVLTVSYPWTDGADWYSLQAPFRLVDDQTLYFEEVEVQSGEVIRLRHTKLHKIEDLDSAASTTLPDRLQRALTHAAGAVCLDIRIRQLAENPAIADHAVQTYRELKREWIGEFTQRMHMVQRQRNPAWPAFGL